jgi:hypothetical protein
MRSLYTYMQYGSVYSEKIGDGVWRDRPYHCTCCDQWQKAHTYNGAIRNYFCLGEGGGGTCLETCIFKAQA